MTQWELRPPEIRNLLNPAFCGEVLRRSARAYQKAAGDPMPYPLLFLVLPIVLHKSTRDALPALTRQMHTWLQANPQVRVDFAKRASGLVPITREAVVFLLQAKVIKIDDRARVTAKAFSTADAADLDGENWDCYQKAGTIGRLFAKTGAPTTLYSMWGVRP